MTTQTCHTKVCGRSRHIMRQKRHAEREENRAKLSGGPRHFICQTTVTLFGLFAEIERTLLSLRTKEALAAAKAAGKALGRPRGALGKSKLDGKKEEIKTLLALRVSKASIAKITGVDRATLYHFIRSRGLMPK